MSQINKQNINKKKHERHLPRGEPHAEGRRRAPNMKIKRNTWLIRLQSPPRMKLDTIKKLIKSRHCVVENSRIAFFPNDLKTDQPNNLKASTNVLIESMCAKTLLHVTPNI
jgi:hypothetical protein